MKFKTLASFLMLTIGLSLGLAVVSVQGMRTIIAANWEKNRCDPGVVMTAAAYKPADDPRTPGQFAEDNWRDCQKEYVQNAIRAAAAVPKDLANAEAATVGVVQDMATAAGDVFYDLWQFIYSAYSSFMDRMKGVAKLFQNFMMQMHTMVERLQASIISIVFALISLVVAFVNSVQVVLMVAIIIVGILVAMEILLFFLLLPIAPLIISITALVSVVVVLVATTIAAAMVSEMYTPGACFTPDTRVVMRDGKQRPMSEIKIGDTLRDGGCVVAVHNFHTDDPVYDLYGIHVTGDHLVQSPNDPTRLIAVRSHPDARLLRSSTQPLVCLTTTTRRIPVLSQTAGTILFADWEEIPEGDEESLRVWHRRVWATLNPTHGYRRPVEATLQSEAGLSPDCQVECPGWFGGVRLRRVADIRAGDVVLDHTGSPTRVVGTVVIEGDQSTDAMNLPAADGSPQIVSAATWVWYEGQSFWAAPTGYRKIDLHPVRWIHLYTAAGTFRLSGGHAVRDASEVGLGNLRPLVEDIVMNPSPPPTTI